MQNFFAAVLVTVTWIHHAPAEQLSCELWLSTLQEGGVLLSDLSLQAGQGSKISPDGIFYCVGTSGTMTTYSRGPPLTAVV